VEKTAHRFLIHCFLDEFGEVHTTAEFRLDCKWEQAEELWMGERYYGGLSGVGYDIVKEEYVLQFQRVCDKDELIDLVENLRQLECGKKIYKVRREGIIAKLRR